ncbi:GIY-YIG nuclease family protein, partial [Virgibacillus sp. M23]|uniref:GIY-YIG nuclease family protein n=1 Tax=Virgibacillus sp. M23 TaxID=3079030 RepID=UPI0039C6A0F2
MSSLPFYSLKEHQTLMTNKKIRGIYIIVNKINIKVYIGSSVNIESRHQGHNRDLRNGKH